MPTIEQCRSSDQLIRGLGELVGLRDGTRLMLLCVCVEFQFTNHALAYNHKFWIYVLPCGNVEAHHIENVHSPVCPTVVCFM